LRCEEVLDVGLLLARDFGREDDPLLGEEGRLVEVV
jgi:hypothetical protein